MLEYEEKLIITKHQYERLLGAFPTLKTITQTNYYYDTEELSLNSRRITFRIREKGNTLIATVKRHSINDAYCSEETTYPVSDIMDHFIYKNQTLRLFGSLVSERSTIVCNDGIECTVDKNTYLNKTDYEIEVEYSPDKLQEANCLMRNIKELLNYNFEDTSKGSDSNMKYSTKSKSERFFEEYQKKGGVYVEM